MKYVFIDTNVLLRVYSYSDDHPLFLKDMIKLIDDKKIEVLVTKQLIDEFYRNRENKLSPSLKEIKTLSNTKFKVPAFCANIQSIKSIRKKHDEINNLAKIAYEKLSKESKSESLEADKLIKKIFDKSKVIKFNEEIMFKAKRRFDLGNPPGKDRSYGDAINWESLLEYFPKKKDLFFITIDGNYLSNISSDDFSIFLRKEWRKEKKSKIILYKSISRFLKDEFKSENVTEKQITEEESVPKTETIDFTKFISSSGTTPASFSGTSPTFLSAGSIGVFSSGSTFFSPIEEEKRCFMCNKVFYVTPGEILKKCPHCHHYC